MNLHKPRNKACTCLPIINGEDEDKTNQQLDQLLLDWICRRGSVKVKLRLNPQRGRSTADPDPLALVSSTRWQRGSSSLSPQPKGTQLWRRRLQLVETKGQAGQLPKAFSTYEEADSRFYPDRDLENWITVVQIPPSVVIALGFVAGRIFRTHVSHAIHLLLKLMMQVTDADELNFTVSDFVDKASTLSKLVERGARGDDFSFLRMLCTKECALESESSGKLWKVSTPAPTTWSTKQWRCVSLERRFPARVSWIWDLWTSHILPEIVFVTISGCEQPGTPWPEYIGRSGHSTSWSVTRPVCLRSRTERRRSGRSC